MQFFASAITTLQTLVIALGAGLGVWGVVNLLEGYGSDNPGAKGWGSFYICKGNGGPQARRRSRRRGRSPRVSAKPKRPAACIPRPAESIKEPRSRKPGLWYISMAGGRAMAA